jgi:thiosulfate/3-mercaptopyruvate sulfurtransferase
MNILRNFAFVVGLLVAFQSAVFGFFSSYNYISPEETAKIIKTAPESAAIVDIQVEEGFKKEHLKGAIDTYSYPVKSDADKAKLESAIPAIKADQKVIIVCPRGGGGAKRAYDHLVEKGISEDRIFILEKGQEGWPREKISDVLVK